MSFPYQTVFHQLEKSLIEYGAKRLPRETIATELNVYKTYEAREMTDALCFSTLVYVTFYSGFRAATVTAKKPTINRWFPDWQTVADYSDDDVAQIMSDTNMIRHRAKIAACIANARTVRELIAEHGSMAHFIGSFGAARSVENLRRLKKVLETRFDYIGGVTVYHFLTEIGFPVLKPDRVVRRIFYRLGLLDSEVDSEDKIVETIQHGRAFAEATGLPIRYIDIVFVAYGQVQALEFGIDRGICLEEPRCHECGIVENCGWYRNGRNN